jgi:hypothetical protein
MSHTKALLDATSLNNIVEDVKITQDIFVNEKGESIKYNGLVIQFDDGQEIRIKLDKMMKLELYMAILVNTPNTAVK